jgi:hypothetical protein
MSIEDCAGRRYGTSDKLYWWRSWEPNTRFAPLVDVPMWVDNVRIELVEKILSQNPNTPWYEQNYFQEDVYGLLDILESMYTQFAHQIVYEMPTGIWIRGWFNVLKPGEALPIHHHSIHENTFLSGNMLLTDSKIHTEYVIPGYSTYGGNFRPMPKAGTVTLFPSWVEHKVNTNESDDDRIALAWDLYTTEAMMYCKEYDPNNEMMLSVPFL